MRYFLLTIILFSTALATSAQHDEETLLFEKYIKYKKRFYSNFIRIDWGGDGIGKFSEKESGIDAWFGRYDKAGYSLPATSHHPTRNRYWWPFSQDLPANESHCNQNPDLSDENGVLVWSEDAGTYLGLYLAVLATEYELLRRNSQTEQMKLKLEEIYLALQAFRRLNMTANRWMKHYLSVTEFKCSDNWKEDLNGFSGLCIRNDVPFYFWKEFHKSGQKYVEYGLMNLPATDEYGKKPDKQGYNCADEPNGVPDVRNIYAASQLSCQAHPVCGYTVKDAPFAYLSPKDPKKLAHEMLGEKFFSQDQTIGLLTGLAFIKKYIPNEAYLERGREQINIIELTRNITLSLVKSLDGPGNSFFLPPCIGKPDNYGGTNSCGYDWRFTKYGICEAINFICDSTVCKGNFSSFSTVLVQGFILGEKPILVDRDGKNEKRRMNYSFYHNLVALADPEKIQIKNSLKDGKEYAPWIEPFYPLMRMLLHDYSDREMSKAGKMHSFAFEQYLLKMRAILNSYGHDGNCVPAKDKTNCNVEGYPHTNIRCESSFVHHETEISGNRLFEWYPYGDDFYGNGLDFMLLYNMYRLAFPYEKRPVYKLNNN